MAVLKARSFFEKLDDLLCPADESRSASRCQGDYVLSEMILRDSGFDGSDFEDILCVLRSQGGCCDCEILYNVSETSRLKSTYWKARAEGLAPNVSHESRE